MNEQEIKAYLKELLKSKWHYGIVKYNRKSVTCKDGARISYWDILDCHQRNNLPSDVFNYIF